MSERMVTRDVPGPLPTTVEELSDRLRGDPEFRAWLNRGLLRETVPGELEVLMLRLIFNARPTSEPSSP